MSGRLPIIWTTDNTRVPEILILMSILLGISTTFTFVRFLSRIRLVATGLWWDDWFCFLALLGAWGHFITQLLELPYGYGRHRQDLPANIDWKESNHIFPAVQITYFAGLGLIKSSICFFILRFSRNLRVPVYVVLAFVTASWIAICVGDALQCLPVAYIWDPTVKGGHCFNRTTFWTAAAWINIASDVVIYLLPIKTLWAVKLPLRQRLALVLVFGVGMFVVIIGFLRLHSLKKAAVTEDQTWDNVSPVLWSALELNMAIVVACLPSFKPLMVSLWSKITGRKPGSSVGGGTRASKLEDMYPLSQTCSSRRRTNIDVVETGSTDGLHKTSSEYSRPVTDPKEVSEVVTTVPLDYDLEKQSSTATMHSHSQSLPAPCSPIFGASHAAHMAEMQYDAYEVTVDCEKNCHDRPATSRVQGHVRGITKTTNVSVVRM